MINQLQQHIVATFGTNQRVLAKAFEEALCERLWRQHIISSGVVRDARGKDFSKIFSGLFIAYIAMKPVISDSLNGGIHLSPANIAYLVVTKRLVGFLQGRAAT